jgi:hypothetical protein
MRLLGFGKPREEGPKLNLLDKIDLESADDIAWVKKSNDPLIWHSVAHSMLLFADDTQDFLAWLVEQDSLDRVTAALMFLVNSNGENYLLGKMLPPERIGGGMGRKQAKINHMIDRLCELDSVRTYSKSQIGLPRGFNVERKKTLSALSKQSRSPTNLLKHRISQRSVTMPYLDIGEGELCSHSYIKETMPFLFE